MKCPCHSDKDYEACCKPYHDGKAPENAQYLMRSRYAAYVLGLADYIIKTTHPTHPQYTPDFATWKKGLEQHAKETQFTGLTILEFIDGDEVAFVTFTAHLKQGTQDLSFTEKSRFVKENGNWLYESASFNK